jgi:hypothetical protein
MIDKIIKIFCEETDYKGEHQSPDKESGYPMWNIIGAYPEDFYSSIGVKHYAYDNNEMYYLVKSTFKRPNKKFMVYRAIPKNIKATINPGDWVTPSLKYAKEHGYSNLNNNYKIIKKMVHARDLFTDGNSIDEWGYDPQPEDPKERLKANVRNKIYNLKRVINGALIIDINKYPKDPYYGKPKEEFEKMLNDVIEKYKNLDYEIK